MISFTHKARRQGDNVHASNIKKLGDEAIVDTQ